VAAAEDAGASSLTTHPGAIATEACRFLAHLLVRCMHGFHSGSGSAAGFLYAEADAYEERLGIERAEAPGVDELRRMLRSDEAPNSTERCWNWRDDSLRIVATLGRRGARYNGYPVSAGYFGSFCLDGLAVALHSVARTDSFGRAIEHCVNLLGDADSTAAIAGQIAGAMYGYQAIDARFKANLHTWDDGQVAMRAALLIMRKQRPRESPDEAVGVADEGESLGANEESPASLHGTRIADIV